MCVVEEQVSSRFVVGPGALLMSAVTPILVVGAIRIYGKRDGDTFIRICRGGAIYRFPLVIAFHFPMKDSQVTSLSEQEVITVTAANTIARIKNTFFIFLNFLIMNIIWFYKYFRSLLFLMFYMLDCTHSRNSFGKHALPPCH